MTDEHQQVDRLSRRGVLRAAGGAALVAGLAGCSGAANRKFTADAVVLPDDAQTTLEFVEMAEQRDRREITRTVAGQDVQATIESFVSAYGEVDGELTLAVLSTPTAAVAGQTLNPLARIGLGELLTNDAAQSFLRSAGVGGSGQVRWERGPDRLGTADTSLLDASVTIESYAGLLAGETTSVVFTHLARTETADSVVIAAGVHGFEVDETTRDYVGTGGYVSPADFEAIVATVGDADAELIVDDSL